MLTSVDILISKHVNQLDSNIHETQLLSWPVPKKLRIGSIG